MKYPDRPSHELLCAMFPGEEGQQVPGFRDIAAYETLEKLFPKLVVVDALLREGESDDQPPVEVNALLKRLKSREPEIVSDFIDRAVTVYFSAPAVSRALTGKPSPLFPHHAVMSEIDYDLLEPVIERAERMTHATQA